MIEYTMDFTSAKERRRLRKLYLDNRRFKKIPTISDGHTSSTSTPFNNTQNGNLFVC